MYKPAKVLSRSEDLFIKTESLYQSDMGILNLKEYV